MRKIEVGRVYRHFKGDHYLVEALAQDAASGEICVVYRKLYGDGGLWVRPFSEFAGPVNRAKYPNADQEYRFQLLEIESMAGH